MASYPNSIKNFTTRQNGEYIDASIVNDLQDEVVAVETELKKTTAATSVNAADSAKLGGLDSTAFLLTTGKAADSAKLGGIDAADYEKGWIPTSGWTINDAASGAVNVSSGALSIYSVGDKVKLTNETVKYFYIVRIEDNYMFLNGGSDYVLSGAYGTALSSISYSHAASPVGFPQWFNWTPSVAYYGGTADPTWTINARFNMQGRIVNLAIIADMVKNAGDRGITYFSIPVPPSLNELPIYGSENISSGSTISLVGYIDAQPKLLFFSTMAQDGRVRIFATYPC